MRLIGIILGLAGLFVILGYMSYIAFVVVFLSRTPLALKVGLPLCLFGLLLLVVSLVRERLRQRSEENLDDVRY